mgnify:CR=1 FL=1
MGGGEDLKAFLALSAHVTGYSTFVLLGTGQADDYLSAVRRVVGDATVAELLQTWGRIEAAGHGDRDKLLRRDLLSHAKLGPIVRRIMKMWYVGTWYELDTDWQEEFGILENNTTFVVSATAYTEGLLWPTIGANPSGAKPFGYGIWATPPRVGLD